MSAPGPFFQANEQPTVMQVSVGDSIGGCAATIREEMQYWKAEGWATNWHHVLPEGAAMRAAQILDPCLYGATDTPFDADTVQTGLEAYQSRFGEELASGDPVDVIVLHDPMCLALAPYARRRARIVAWRCHIGHTTSTPASVQAEQAMARFLDDVDVIIFIDKSLAWPSLQADPRLIGNLPGTDPTTWKNRELAPDVVDELWSSLVLGRPFPDVDLPVPPGGPAGDRLVRGDSLASGDPDAPFLLQVARWDPLKGHPGVLAGFTTLAQSDKDLELLLLGPRMDPEHSYPIEQVTWDQLVAARETLEPSIRRRVHLWRFSTHERMVEDLFINVAQRKADTVVQNSRRESFGLTVAESLCKGAVVVGSDAEGIGFQIDHDQNGLQTPYTDRASEAWIETVRRAHTDTAGRKRWSENARITVRERLTMSHSVRRQIGVFEAFAASNLVG